MKIGILTYHRAHNYWAILQAYSLKRILEKLNHKVHFVDYWPRSHQNIYDYWLPSYLWNTNISIFNRLFRILDTFLSFGKKSLRYENFHNFIIHFFDITTHAQFTSGEMIEEDADVIVYGSDQIWWHSNGIFDVAYWGDYLRGKKISYGASMGSIHRAPERKSFIKDKLNNFDAISVREKNLQQFLFPLTDKEVHLVLDPVFLLNVSEWTNDFSLQKTPRKFILLYSLRRSTLARNLAYKIWKIFDCEIVEISGATRSLYFYHHDLQDTIGPTEFLQYFYQASFVISTSFHGVAFSILFWKQFYATDMVGKSDRVKSLLFLLGIEERYVSGVEVDLESSIDYRHVQKKLELLKISSLRFLKTSIDRIWES